MTNTKKINNLLSLQYNKINEHNIDIEHGTTVTSESPGDIVIP